jgi:hypothetical protein
MRSSGHLVGQTPTSHEAISHAEHMFTQLLGGRFCTSKDPNDQRSTQAFPNLGGSF